MRSSSKRLQKFCVVNLQPLVKLRPTRYWQYIDRIPDDIFVAYRPAQQSTGQDKIARVEKECYLKPCYRNGARCVRMSRLQTAHQSLGAEAGGDWKQDPGQISLARHRVPPSALRPYGESLSRRPALSAALTQFWEQYIGTLPRYRRAPRATGH